MIEITLTLKQQEAVDYDGKEMLIKGIAGSGKTLVLLNKANKILAAQERENVYLFTYNGTLAAYAKELAAMIGSDRLHVYTFHSWASRMLAKLNIRMQMVKGDEQEELLRNSVMSVCQTAPHRLVAEEKYFDFLAEEISWIKGKSLFTLESYLQAERTGRGTKVNVDQKGREVIFAVFQQYQGDLKRLGQADFDDLAAILDRSFAQLGPLKDLDNVLIDEAQDLQEIQLKLLRKCANKRMIIAADKGQKIYNTSFTWRDIGINITGGRTKVLHDSFRSTKQIIELAYSLQKHDPIYKDRDEEFVHPVVPQREGPVPRLIQCGGYDEEEEYVLRSVQELYRLNPNWKIGILCRKNASLSKFQKRLPPLGVPAEYVKKMSGSAFRPGVKLLSFHSAKGLEFDAVFLYRLREKVIPIYDQAEDLDEDTLSTERRLLYVAITRAKSVLVMTYYGRRSRFIDELDPALYRYEGVGR
ncbi:ATP-dependent helicase [Cohnella luojiensis]|nr:ATP-dependent helicase [Cohnella luojiensis]